MQCGVVRKMAFQGRRFGVARPLHDPDIYNVVFKSKQIFNRGTQNFG